ncbi:MAG: SAF domain-containing protein [Actinomycetaceae bacterium]|nr:SAF domain-containing protein [Actinomycetaceae bacterium]
MTVEKIRIVLWRFRYMLIALACISFVGGIIEAIYALEPPKDTVLVLAKDVEAGSILTSRDLEVKKVPKDFIPNNSVNKENDVVGKPLIASFSQGTPLNMKMVLSEEFLQSPPSGSRILALPLDAANVSIISHVGAHITLYSVDNSSEHKAEKIVDDAVVMGIGEETNGSFLSTSDATQNVYVAVPESSAGDVIAKTGTSELKVVLNP